MFHPSRAATSSAIRVLVTLLAAIGAPALHAATFCVATGDQLNTALAVASNNAENDDIKIEYGTLTSSAQAPQNYRWIYDARDDENATTISGGWSKGNSCASIATNDPVATLLDAQWAGPVFLADLRMNFTGSLTISNLTFYRGDAFGTPCFTNGGNVTCAPGLAVDAWGGSVVIDRVLITSGRTHAGVNAPIAYLFHNGNGSIKLQNSIVMGNTLDTGLTTRGVYVYMGGNAVAYVWNNSIFHNTVTSNEAGLIVKGVASVSNNAVADNTSTSGVVYQYTAYEAPEQSLRNNHFGNSEFKDGSPFINENATSGDAQWTLDNYRMVPNAESVLRDSGDNTPTGGIPLIDFSGNTRIINGVIDRGAVEADPPAAPIGPSLNLISPSNGYTTTIHSIVGNVIPRFIHFTSSGGNLGGSTTLSCVPVAGTPVIAFGGNQTIATGASPDLVTINLTVTDVSQIHTVGCQTIRSNGPIATYFFHYLVAPDVILSDGFETSP